MYIGSQLYFTRGIQNLLDNKEIGHDQIWECIARHIRLDYGDTCKEDARLNDRNLNANCGTVHSSYTINGHRIWVITSIGDIDTTYTSVILPSEY